MLDEINFRIYIKQKGWIVIPSEWKVKIDEIKDLLGPVISENNIRVTKDSNQFIHTAGNVEYHTDDPRADYILWKCEEPADEGGENLLKDLRSAFYTLSKKHQQDLKSLSFMVDLPGAPTEVNCILNQDTKYPTFYYAPWKSGSNRDRFNEEALFFLTIALEQAPTTKVMLKRGDSLILYNRRFVHGRLPYEGDQRHLRRVLMKDSV